MAKRHYILDSAILLPSSPMQCALSDVAGRAIVPSAGPTADDMSLSSITPIA